LWVLWKYAWKPIADGLEKRERLIANRIAEAERSNQDARQILADYEKKLSDSQQEVRALLEQARRDAEKVSRDMLARAKEEATAERQQSLQQIEAATAGALQELAQRSATLAVELAGKIVRRRLDPGDHAQLIREAVSEFAADGGKKA
jgi:F-type H+-transporting ATPase subunit b